GLVQLDDLPELLLGLGLCTRSAPPDIVEEHLGKISQDKDQHSRDIPTAERLPGDRLGDVRDTVDKFRARGEGPPMGQGPQGRKAAGRKKRESTGATATPVPVSWA